MDLIKVEQVSKQYTGHKALDDVSLSIPKGSIYGLLGPNGAGKTTLIRIINRITAPDTGRILFEGHPIAPEDVARIGYLPEERGLYKKMKVGEQAVFFARLKGVPRHEAIVRLKQWFKRFEIEDWWDKKVEELSKGMAQKVQFIITILHEPKLLIFDEPFSGFDPINTQQLKNEILRLNDQGATIIFSTHNMGSVEEICKYITLINRSHNILSGAVDEIRRQHGENLFRLSFRGEKDRLLTLLKDHCRIYEPKKEEGELQTLQIQLEEGMKLKDLITVANEQTDLRGFEQIIPSMNDIFIRAVNGNL